MSKLDIDTTSGEAIINGQRWPLRGSHATVETTGQIRSRYTLTRFLLLGPFALAFKKKIDERKTYVTLTTVAGEVVAVLDGKAELAVRVYASQLNTAAARLAELDIETAGDFRA
jgi:hypothetical protein